MSVERGAIAAIVALAVALGVSFSNRDITGLYHDDGIYLATARSLAENGSYRLINLPGAPFATKYPPLYSAVLAIVWKAMPSFPDNLVALKAVNSACLGCLLLVVWRLTQRIDGLGSPERVFAVVFAATSPGLFSLTDLVLSDLLFTTFFIAVLAAYPPDPTGSSLRPVVAAAVLAGLSALTRTLGVAICLGLVLHLLIRGTVRRALFAAAVIAACLLPWAIWSVASRPLDSNPLLRYYFAYEPSAWSQSESASRVLAVLTANARFFATEAAIPFGLSGMLIGTTGLALIVAGLFHLRKQPVWSLVGGVAAFYAFAILAHPYPMVRYLVPWVPVAYVAMAGGLAALRSRTTVGNLALVPAALVLAGNVAWLAHFHGVTATRIHGEFGRALPFEWTGYRETAEWIRTQTPADARLASGDDTLYFVYTGRCAVRPWIHQPEHYTPGFGFGPPHVDPAGTQRALDDLGVGFVVIDPQLSGGEAEFARRSLESLVTVNAGAWTLRFTSSNREHRVYQRTSADARNRPS